MVSLDGHPKQMLWWCYVKLGGHRRFAEVHRGRILTSTWSNAWGLFLLIRRTGALDSSTESGEDLNAQVPLLLSEIFPVFPSNSSVFNDSFKCFNSSHRSLDYCLGVVWFVGREAIPWRLRTENSTPVWWQIFPHLQFIIRTASPSTKNRQCCGVVAGHLISGEAPRSATRKNHP